MSIIPQGNENNQECESRISKLFSSYKIGDLLRKCGVGKEKGVARQFCFPFTCLSKITSSVQDIIRGECWPI